MADETNTNNPEDSGASNDDQINGLDNNHEPLSPQEADNTDYGLMKGQRVQPIDLQQEMRESYLAYALSVIVERALPDVRDGMKPVHRRVIYAMYDGGYRPDRGYNKCSRVVGDVMGKYHPHGDAAIYDTLVRMAQPWSMRYPLVDGQGNFGSPGDDPAAAMRYTECRMAPLAMEMVRDIDKDTVDFSRTCWSTVPPASPSAWPPTSRRTTCAKWLTAYIGRSTILTRAAKNCSTRSSNASRGRTSRPERLFSATRASNRRTAPAVA